MNAEGEENIEGGKNRERRITSAVHISLQK